MILNFRCKKESIYICYINSSNLINNLIICTFYIGSFFISYLLQYNTQKYPNSMSTSKKKTLKCKNILIYIYYTLLCERVGIYVGKYM